MLVLNLYDKIDNATLSMDSDFFKDLGYFLSDIISLIIVYG